MRNFKKEQILKKEKKYNFLKKRRIKKTNKKTCLSDFNSPFNS